MLRLQTKQSYLWGPKAGSSSQKVVKYFLLNLVSAFTCNLESVAVNIFPIQCSDLDTANIHALLWPIGISPVNIWESGYLWKKLTKKLQSYIDAWLGGCQVGRPDLLTKECHMILVQHVLTLMLVYLVMAIDLPSWTIKANGKIRRGFLWQGNRCKRWPLSCGMD